MVGVLWYPKLDMISINVAGNFDLRKFILVFTGDIVPDDAIDLNVETLDFANASPK